MFLTSVQSVWARQPIGSASQMDAHALICWFMHQQARKILIPGLLPWNIDAVVFCSKCDRYRGRAVQVFSPLAFHAL